VKIYFLFIASILFFSFTRAQVINFEKTYGLAGYNEGRQILPVEKNSYILLGNTSGFYQVTNIYFAKLDSAGKIIWDKTYGGDTLCWGNSFKQTRDNGFIITGYTTDANGNYMVLLLKTDSSGQMQWKKTYGGSNWNFGYDLLVSKDSGYVIAGKTYSYGKGNADAYVIKTNSYGDTLWTKTYGDTAEDVAESIDTLNNNFIIAGYSNSFGTGEYDGYIINIDQNGNLNWYKIFGSTYNTEFFKIKHTKDTCMILVGCSTIPTNTAKTVDYIIKMDSLGKNFLWSKQIGGCNALYDVTQDNKGNFLVGGYTDSCGGSDICGGGKKDCILIFMDNQGNNVRGKTFGKANDELCYSANFTRDGGYILAGTTWSEGLGISNIFVVKTDSNFYANDSNIIQETAIKNIIPNEKNNILIFPNPTSGIVYINNIDPDSDALKISLYDLCGNLCYNTNYQKSINKIDIHHLENGMYIIKIENGSQQTIKKIILNKI